MTSMCIMPFTWVPIKNKALNQEQTEQLARRVDLILKSWEKTPYRLGESCKGRGVDCIHFMSGVLDELYGFPREAIAKLQGDTCLHSPKSAKAAMRVIIRTYSSHKRVTDDTIEPGDALVTGPINGGPGHVMIAGTLNRLWHATLNNGIEQTGSAYRPDLETLHEIYRATDKEKWLPC